MKSALNAEIKSLFKKSGQIDMISLSGFFLYILDM